MAAQTITIIKPESKNDVVYNYNNTVVQYSRSLTCFYKEKPNRSGDNMKKQDEKKEYQKQGNPYKRGDTWTYIYYVTDPITGKKIQKRKGGYKSKKEAEQALKETEALIATEQYTPEDKSTTGVYVTNWFNDIHKARLSPNSINAYTVCINKHIVPGIGHIPLNRINHNDVSRFYNKLISDSKLSVASVKLVHKVLQKSMKEAVLSDFIRKNPCEGVSLPKRKKFKSSVLTESQIKDLLVKSVGSNVYLEVMLSLTLGLRRGEVMGLMISDFDFDNKTVRIHQQVATVIDRTKPSEDQKRWGIKDLKTEDSNRILYVPQMVLDAVQARIDDIEHYKTIYGYTYQDYGLLCCQANGSCESPHNVYHRFKALLKDCDMPDIRFHDLRHSYATALLEWDVPLKVISNQLGHSSINITADVYCDVLEKKKQPANMIQDKFFTS